MMFNQSGCKSKQYQASLANLKKHYLVWNDDPMISYIYVLYLYIFFWRFDVLFTGGERREVRPAMLEASGVSLGRRQRRRVGEVKEVPEATEKLTDLTELK